MIGIREFNKKIISLKNTRKMTKTMKMVSASKFKRAHKSQHNALVYANKMQEVMGRLALSNEDGIAHPVLAVRKKVSNVLVVVFTSDKGLCGGFNNNLIRRVRLWNTENSKNVQIQYVFAGRKGHMALRRTVQVLKDYEGITHKPTYLAAQAMAEEIIQGFIAKKYDEVYLAYNKFISPLAQTPNIEKLIPLDPTVLLPKDNKIKNGIIEYEPEISQLLELLIPKFLAFKIYFTLLENAAGEHGARMNAMDKASSNTADLIDRYVLLRNRARQAAITTELIEIISGAEALK